MNSDPNETPIQTGTINGKGWIPDIPDARDHLFLASLKSPGKIKLPPSVDLRPACSPVYDQGQIGSCTGQAIAGCLDFMHKRTVGNFYLPSRYYIYYYERVALGTVNIDSGGMLRDGIKIVAKNGAPPESLWPHIPTNWKKKPSKKAEESAHLFQAISYKRLDCRNITELKLCLFMGQPFVFGLSLYESFEYVYANGIVKTPEKDEKMLGGHAMMCVGYNDATKRFIVRNSWGTAWGLDGYCSIPYEYMCNPNMADDFWCITEAE